MEKFYTGEIEISNNPHHHHHSTTAHFEDYCYTCGNTRAFESLLLIQADLIGQIRFTDNFADMAIQLNTANNFYPNHFIENTHNFLDVVIEKFLTRYDDYFDFRSYDLMDELEMTFDLCHNMTKILSINSKVFKNHKTMRLAFDSVYSVPVFNEFILDGYANYAEFMRPSLSAIDAGYREFAKLREFFRPFFEKD
jgi:hypothetical protein